MNPTIGTLEMAPNRRCRTSRRVTAQRKFAQGAIIPPVAGPNNNASTSERREVPATNESNIFHTNMSATGLLDMVCYQGSHSHVQPIVLVEKLRGRNVRKDQQKEQRPRIGINKEERGLKVVRPKPKASRRSKVVRTKLHVMTLRNRKEKINPKFVSCASGCGVGKKVSLPRSPKINAPKPTRQILRNSNNRCSPEFSLDDNRPLKYLAKCSTPKASRSRTLMGPPNITPRYITPPSSIEIMSSIKLDTSTLTPSVTPVPEIEPSSQSVNAFGNTQIVNVATVSDQYFSELRGEPTMLLFPPSSDAFRPERSSVVSYYSEQGIHRWIDDSLPEKRTSPAAQQHPVSSQYDNEESRPESELPDVCTAARWKSIEDVVKAPKANFDSRCTMCRQCDRVEKVIKLTTLLKRQRKIDCLTDDIKDVEQASSSRAAEQNLESTDGNLNLTSELLPRHPHLMIKMTVMTINAKKKYAACLIPRSEATLGSAKQFMLYDHDYILDQVIETLSLNLGDPPSNLVPSEESPKATGSCSAGHFEKPECSKYVEKTIEEDDGNILEAPTFWLSHEDFFVFRQEPIAFIEKMWDTIAPFGICKIVAPHSFVPICNAEDDLRFEVTNQYTTRLYNRWGPAAREMCAIKACLKAQNISFQRPPLVEGLEVNLSKLYHVVQRHGGLEHVINKKKWGKVADDMKFSKNPTVERKLDSIYFKYLLPYDTLSAEERQELLRKVEKAWNRKNQKLLERASNPLHRQKILMGESDSSSDETEDDLTDDAEDCVKPGINMNLAKFKKIARTAFDIFFRNQTVSSGHIEEEYWRRVTSGTDHVCVNSASVDTREQGLGFPQNKTSQNGNHPWNLKILSEHPSNVLRSLGPAVGVTIPTLHVGMVFSTSCWHRDPHSIAWVEFAHRGSAKIWYGVPEQQDLNFRTGTETLIPTACQKKSLWLSSDITMIPPNLLREQGVKVSRVVQNPGEYVVVMPRAYSCSISTGYTVSESVYFATERWLDNLMPIFSEVHESCEPTMFALEQLLKCIAEDPSSKRSVLKKIQPALELTFQQELKNRQILKNKGVMEVLIPKLVEIKRPDSKGKGRRIQEPVPPPVWNVREEDECEICRCTLYLSKVKDIPSRDSFVCLEHAIKLLSGRKYALVKMTDLQMQYVFSDEELLSTIETVQLRLGTYNRDN